MISRYRSQPAARVAVIFAPCLSPLICVASICRKRCTMKSCNAPGSCGTTEACVNTQNNTPVCIPGVGKGQSCSASAPCQGGHLCLATDPKSSTGKCFATCTSAGAACAGGSKCYTISGSSCLYCYP